MVSCTSSVFSLKDRAASPPVHARSMLNSLRYIPEVFIYSFSNTGCLSRRMEHRAVFNFCSPSVPVFLKRLEHQPCKIVRLRSSDQASKYIYIPLKLKGWKKNVNWTKKYYFTILIENIIHYWKPSYVSIDTVWHVAFIDSNHKLSIEHPQTHLHWILQRMGCSWRWVGDEDHLDQRGVCTGVIQPGVIWVMVEVHRTWMYRSPFFSVSW